MSKVKKPKYLVSGSVGKLLRKHFPGLEVIDATAPLRMFPEQCDVVKGTRKDPALCLLHQTHERVHCKGGSLIWLQYAYFELPDENGVMRIERFYVPMPTRKFIENYDRTGTFKAGVCVNFLPPNGSHTFEVRKERQVAFRSTKLGKSTAAVSSARKVERAAIRRVEADREKLVAVKQVHSENSPIVKLASAAVKNSTVSVAQAHEKVVRAETTREDIHKAKKGKYHNFGGGPIKMKFTADVRSGHPGAKRAAWQVPVDELM